MRTCAPPGTHPGSRCELLRDWPGCAQRSDGEETSRCSHAPEGQCQRAICALVSSGTSLGSPSPPGDQPQAGGECLARPHAGHIPCHRSPPCVTEGFGLMWRLGDAGSALGRGHWGRSDEAGVPILCWSLMHLQFHPDLILPWCWRAKSHSHAFPRLSLAVPQDPDRAEPLLGLRVTCRGQAVCTVLLPSPLWRQRSCCFPSVALLSPSRDGDTACPLPAPLLPPAETPLSGGTWLSQTAQWLGRGW